MRRCLAETLLVIPGHIEPGVAHDVTGERHERVRAAAEHLAREEVGHQHRQPQHSNAPQTRRQHHRHNHANRKLEENREKRVNQ